MNDINNQPLVSILLSIYNVEKYLEECLDSILAQSYQNLEIVCVDNASPDNCGKILETYAQKDKRIKIVTLKKNRKLCGGRNVGLDNATGDFIGFVDPDDWIEKDHIKSMVEAIQTQKDPEGNPYNLVVNYAISNYMQSSPTSKREIMYGSAVGAGHYSIKDYNKNPSELEAYMPMWGRLYRKSFLDHHKEVRFLEGFFTDNIPYTTKLLAHMKYFYAISSHSNTNSTYWRRLITIDGGLTPFVLFKNMEMPDCLEDLYDYLKKYGYERKVRVMFYLIFTLCFPRHKNQYLYYKRFKLLMLKMESDIKSAPDVYPQCDRDLCDLLIKVKSFVRLTQICCITKRYITIFGFKVIKVRNRNLMTRYYFLSIFPVLSVRYKFGKMYYRLFSCIPVWNTKAIY